MSDIADQPRERSPARLATGALSAGLGALVLGAVVLGTLLLSASLPAPGYGGIGVADVAMQADSALQPPADPDPRPGAVQTSGLLAPPDLGSDVLLAPAPASLSAPCALFDHGPRGPPPFDSACI